MSASFFDPDISKCSDTSSVFNVSLDGDSCKGPEEPAAKQHYASQDVAHHAHSQEGHTHFQVKTLPGFQNVRTVAK
jgi:hypothetical protein